MLQQQPMRARRACVLKWNLHASLGVGHCGWLGLVDAAICARCSVVCRCETHRCVNTLSPSDAAPAATAAAQLICKADVSFSFYYKMLWLAPRFDSICFFFAQISQNREHQAAQSSAATRLFCVVNSVTSSNAIHRLTDIL